MASAVARAYNGGLGLFFHLHIQQKRQICHIFCLFPVFCTCKRDLFARETDIKHRDARDGKFYPCAVLTMVKTRPLSRSWPIIIGRLKKIIGG